MVLISPTLLGQMPAFSMIVAIRLSFPGGRVTRHLRGPFKVGLIFDERKESVDRLFEGRVYGQAYAGPGRTC